MITLYDCGNTVCCQKVRITLCEKGLDWQSVKADLFRSEQYDPNDIVDLVTGVRRSAG
jgi:glutathione S-transferase